MILFKRPQYFAIFCLLVLVSCAVETEPELPSPTSVAVPTKAEIAIIPSEATFVVETFSTLTPIPTATATLPPTNTPISTETPSPTATATHTLVPTLEPTVPLNLTCPDVNPSVPNYRRNWLGSEVWPTPLPNPQPHFWMDKPLPGGGRYLINPTFPYGWDQSGRLVLHNGVDSGGGGLGTELPAVGDGVVVTARSDENEWWGFRCNWYGQLVVIELDEKFYGQSVYALYGHVLNIAVEEGDRVRRGETVAEVGFGGAASVPHLHFEVRVGNNDYISTRNPMLWVRPPDSRGVIVGRLVDPSGRPWQGVWISAQSLSEQGVEQITWSYLDDPTSLINPDEVYAENFVFNDVLPGNYRLYLEIQGKRYTADVSVDGGEVSTVEIVTVETEQEADS
ncbi:MAG: peptidoglycan DD-metalloendopeptidase family protein [Chloroflexota bacterium]